MSFTDLPRELIDLILDKVLFPCSVHPSSSRVRPCFALHKKNFAGQFTQLRLVCRVFESSVTPPLFQTILSKTPRYRSEHYYAAEHSKLDSLAALSQSRLMPFVHELRLTISPMDWAVMPYQLPWPMATGTLRREDVLLLYLSEARDTLCPIFKAMRCLRSLFLTTTYEGLISKSDTGVKMPMSTRHLLFPALAGLVEIVHDAEMESLETLQLGIPFEGGYGDFFEDARSRTTLECLRDKVEGASVKLYDRLENFTVMPIF